MNRRRFLATAATLAAAPALLTLPGQAAEARQKVRLATLMPKDTSGHKALTAMADRLRQTTGGRVDITNIYTDGVMGSESDMLRRIRAGQLHAALLTAGGLAEIERSVICLQDMPLLFGSLEEFTAVRDSMLQRFRERMLEKGFMLLFLGDAGWVRYFSKTKALLPDDFRRLKLFANRNDDKYIKTMRRAGFQPVPLEFTDILQALSSGNMLDALACPPFYALAGQFYTAAQHMVELNWAPMVGGAVISRKVWDPLSDADKEALLKVAVETGKAIETSSRRESDEAVAAMKKRGLQVHTLDAPAKAAWDKFATELRGMVRGELVPADLFDEVTRAVQAQRAKAGQ